MISYPIKISYAISYMISYMISYHMKHINLTVLSLKAVSCQVEGIASCLWPSAVALTFPLNAAECPKLSFSALAEDQYDIVYNYMISLT
jgi:hypothetical protein